jgi:hypothetical protein
MRYIDISTVVWRTMVLSRVIGRPGNSLGRDDRAPITECFIPTNDPHSQFERASIRRETYVCFRLRTTVASRHCVQPEINGPLFCVKPPQVGGRESKAEGRIRLFVSGQRAGSKGKSSISPLIYHADGRLNSYLLSQDAVNRRENLYCQI